MLFTGAATVCCCCYWTLLLLRRDVFRTNSDTSRVDNSHGKPISRCCLHNDRNERFFDNACIDSTLQLVCDCPPGNQEQLINKLPNATREHEDMMNISTTW